MNAKPQQNHHFLNQKTFDRVSSLLVVLMMGCIGVSIAQLGATMMGISKLWMLPVLCVLVSLERFFTFSRLRRLVVFSTPWFVFHVTQWVVILLVLKGVLLLLSPPESWRVAFQLWQIHFFESFFDPPYIYTILFTAAIWMICGYFAQLLHEMSLEEAMIRYETAIMAPTDDPPARERLLGVIFFIGFFLVATTAILRVNLRLLLQGGEIGPGLIQPLPTLAAGAWNVLLYFLLGLSLMSLSQFARLNARWSFQKIEVVPNMAVKWAGYSIGFILLVTILASLLPTSYSLNLLSSISQIVMLIYGIVVYILSFIFSAIIFLFGLLASLLGIKPPEQGAEAPPAFIPPEMPAAPIPDSVHPWWDLVRSLVFWLVFGGLVVFSVITFARQHRDFWQSLTRAPLLSWFANAWRMLKQFMKGTRKQFTAMIDSALERIRSRQGSVPGKTARELFPYRRLNNRQRVLSTFFTMMRRSGQRGIIRKGSQTPYEFARELQEAVPETDEEVAEVTEAFVHARYSTAAVDEERVSLVRQYWTAIREALGRVRK